MAKFALALVAMCAFAQMRDPFPPMGGGGIPLPRRGKTQTQVKIPPQVLTGVLQNVTEKELTIETADKRAITVRRDEKTTFTGREVDRLKPGDEVRIEGSQGNDGWFSAVSVQFLKEGVAPPPEEAAAEDEPEQERPRRVASRPDLPPLSGDDGPPRTRRGKPAPKKRSGPAVAEAAPEETEWRDTSAPATATRSAPKTEDETIAKAREAVARYAESLPNYLVQQQVARYSSTTVPVNWRAEDVVSASLVYENGKERYSDLKVNGKPVKKRMEELEGAWSKGEFGTVLVDLFAPATAADFWPLRASTIAGRAASVYGFEVDQAHSHWTVQVAGQVFRPAYKGSVWIDHESKQVLRIEMQARLLPKDFPLSTVESSVDYEFIRLAERQFLLPVHSESLSCERGNNNCTRNVIDFRNYRRFAGESKISY